MAIDTTVAIFDKFYDLNLVVNAQEYEVVRSFFVNNMSNKAAADSFTISLFRVANETQSSVMDLLQTFKSNEHMQIQLTMAYYLNSVSNKTVMFGVNNLIAPNNLVQRNIVQ